MALGRKNYLFYGSDGGGHRAALIYPLIESAKLNHLDPYAYFVDILTKLPLSCEGSGGTPTVSLATQPRSATVSTRMVWANNTMWVRRTLTRRSLNLRCFYAVTYRGRDARYRAPPAQNRTGPIRAFGSHLG